MFSGRTGANFRKYLDPHNYKSGRKDKPDNYWDIVDAIEARHRWFRVEGLEADDLMGIAGTDPSWGETVIVSIDKDMSTVPCRVFNPAKDIRPRHISEPMGDLFWMTQTLTGDATDGYKGCPKIGPVNAARILEEAGTSLTERWRAVLDTFAAAHLPPAHALLQARLARILRAGDYDKHRKEIKLWHLSDPVPLALTETLSAAGKRGA
jgi:DNA polymerase-1